MTSLSASVLTTIVVTIGVYSIGFSLAVSLLLGCIAAATDAAAILDVIVEYKREHPFKNFLVSIVALDDAWALIIFAFGLSLVNSFNGGGFEFSTLVRAFIDIGGAILLGLMIGFPAARLSGRLKAGKPMLTEALGIILLCGGLANLFHVSFLITGMIVGMIITNFAKHHDQPFIAIEGIEEQFMVVFFILAGASLELTSVATLGLLGSAYVALRVSGKLIGARFGCLLGSTDRPTKRWLGLTLMPQAGVAIGMALVAANSFPEHRELLLTTAISSTILFELFGPILTRFGISKVIKESDMVVERK